jgi:hypothetical protein
MVFRISILSLQLYSLRVQQAPYIRELACCGEA